jgi:tetratricopeptide (TPR) repeat protein
VVANYFFDSIPQDAFRIDEDRLHESLVTLATEDGVADPADPELLGRLVISFSQRPLPAPFYGNPLYDRILEEYRQRLPGTTVLFPVEGLRTIGRLRKLAGDRLLLLTADKGFVSEAALAGEKDPFINRHGSVSLNVNFQAIGRWTELEGGEALFTSHDFSSLNVCAFLFGRPEGGHGETRLAFEQTMEQAGPDDFYLVKKALEPHMEDLTLEQALAFMRLTGWDPAIFWLCLPALSKLAAEADRPNRRELRLAVYRLWQGYYHIGEEPDLPFYLGVILYKMGLYLEALEFFQRSLELYGQNANALFNMAVCFYNLKDMTRARAYAQAALELDPELEQARKMMETTEQGAGGSEQ